VNKVWKKLSKVSISSMLVFTMMSGIPAFAETTPNQKKLEEAASSKPTTASRAMSFSTLAAPAPAIIDNGTVQLGIHPEGHLNVSGGTNSMPSDSTSIVGLRYIPTNGESTAPGCLCEGWGVANADEETGSFSGYANIDSDGGVRFLTALPETGVTSTEGHTKPESVGSAYKSVVQTTNGRLKVTHDYKPSSSANLYNVEVTIENLSSEAVGDLRYRRVMDWDIAPYTFNEHVELHIGNAEDVLRITTDGFESANPLVINQPYTGSPPATLVPGSLDHMSVSPSDQGSLFDFGFGRLESGEKRVFQIYYGAAQNRAEALTALSQVGAEVYSFGIPSANTGAAALNGPHIFIFAFGSVGGVAVDTIAPTTTAVLNPEAPNGDNGWYTTEVNVTLNAVDNESGSGVDKTFYRINGGEWQAYTAPFSLTTDGEYTVDYYSTDLEGNVEEPKSTSVKIDKTAPLTYYTFSPIFDTNSSGRQYIKGFHVDLEAVDNLSTVTGTVYRINSGEWADYTGQFTIYANTDLMVEYYSTDKAGNKEAFNIMDFIRGIFTGNRK
jgi:hypothetical protein